FCAPASSNQFRRTISRKFWPSILSSNRMYGALCYNANSISDQSSKELRCQSLLLMAARTPSCCRRWLSTYCATAKPRRWHGTRLLVTHRFWKNQSAPIVSLNASLRAHTAERSCLIQEMGRCLRWVSSGHSPRELSPRDQASRRDKFHAVL